MTEETAINVTEEARNTYFDNFKELSGDLQNKISLHMLDHIFRYMVVPAIEKARKFDREHGPLNVWSLRDFIDGNVRIDFENHSVTELAALRQICQLVNPNRNGTMLSDINL